MAIYTQRTSFRPSANVPDFLVTGPLYNGQLLCYSETYRAFINKDASTVITGGGGGGGGGGGTIVGAINIGTGAEIFTTVNLSDEIQLRTLLGGQGISIVEGINEIEIINDIVSTASISVPHSFTIEIDNDDTTLDVAIFEILTNSNPASVALTPTAVYSTVDLDVVVVSDPGGTDPGQFVSTYALATEIGLVGATYTTGETIVINTVTVTLSTGLVTVTGTVGATYTNGETIVINGNTVTLSTGIDVDDAVTDITTAAIAGITATNVGGALEINSTTVDITLAEGSGTALADLGFTPNTYALTSTVDDAVVDINGALITDVTAVNYNSALKLTGSNVDLTLVEGSGTALADLGFTAGTTTQAFTDFGALGFAAGMCLKVTGTTEQDGIWEIASIDTTTNPNDTITITVHFTDDTDDGSQPATTLEAMFLDFTANTIQVFGRDFVADGFISGQTIDIIGSTSNDGSYTIDTVAGDTITVLETIPVIGCDVGDVTIEVPNVTHSTGWWVNELGQMWTNDITVCGDIDVNCDGDINIDTGTLNIGGVDIIDLINNAAFVSPADGIVVQTGVGTFAGREIEVGTGLSIVDGDGIAGNPTIDVDSFDIALIGDVTGSATVTGLTNTSINIVLDTIVTAGTYNTVTVDAKGRVTAGTSTPFSGFQPADPTLDNLSGGLTSTGYVVWDDTNSIYIDRIITGTPNEIIVTDGDGGLANTKIGISENPVIPGVEAMTIPKGFAGDYPAIPIEGMMRYHMNSPNYFEGYTDTGWHPFLMGSLDDYLPLAGGVMFGDIDMGGTNITNVNFVDGRDVAADGLVLDAINTGTGIKVQIALDTFVNREIDGIVPIVVTDGDGLSGNPTVEFDMLLVTALEIGQIVDENQDYVLIFDDSQGELRRVTPKQLFYHPARRYFMGQF